ncbi:leukocyte elastase inhibitor-like isoform 1-T2 [Pholidichthys leucotaenia]
MDTSDVLPKATTTFWLALFKTLNKENGTSNIFFSPWSIIINFLMVRLGARGNTATQISEVLGLTETKQPNPPEEPQLLQQSERQTPVSALMQTRLQTRMQMQTQQRSRLPDYLTKCLKREPEEDVHSKVAECFNMLKEVNPTFVLSIANQLYVEKTYEILQEFIEATKKYHNTEPESVDFSNDTETVRVSINSWVEDQTGGKIKDLLAKDAVDNMTKIVLVNAIYFKAKWHSEFKEDFTKDAEFKLNKTDTKTVKMMNQTGKFLLGEIDKASCQVLEMPYIGKDISMIIFLPNEMEDDTTGLEKLEKELTYENFLEWTSEERMDLKEVNVTLPRFKLEETCDLKVLLCMMGMVDAFDATKSDFSGMSSANDLVLSKAVHKACVEVNEEGTEAAAATATVVMNRSITIPSDFTVDHPFLFFIRHNPTKTILFGGRCCSPE